jgi:UDP-N-acetylglucosamine 1-carboxyvinyltransferase
MLAAPENARGELPAELAEKMRASVIIAGPLLARVGSARFPHPGGCVIGERPINFFLEGFARMGVQVEIHEGAYCLTAPQGGLRGTDIFFPFPSVTSTETLMLTAVRAQGTTVLRNAAMEPEVVFLAELLRQGGARISGEGTPTITIQGGTVPLFAPRHPLRVIPDRIETASFLILAALLGKEIAITECEPEHARCVIELLEQSGATLVVEKRRIIVRASKQTNVSVSVKTHEYPGFPTDAQAPWAVFLTQAEGQGLIHETIFEGRLAYTADLVAMGADITLYDAHRAAVRGPTPLRGRELYGPDLRAGLAYVIAALVAEGPSVIHNAHYIDRGHEALETRLAALGARIKRV